ncbi:hypothetical protein MOV10_14330 [Salmonella enterica subsp. enterica serovar Abeokuta]|uniref:Uncharacterized protein n=1 Tax=Salmonella enterica subsp. enterica serovar Abeokuta TaxID=2926665 RepID=A0A8T9IEN8_SALET|nr:hypothetical protein [Salmonella enterica]UNO32316.1 hypothetical protein MOV10_14330 [Salmonella enterica subsp. enterica serovar Abeokuta]
MNYRAQPGSFTTTASNHYRLSCSTRCFHIANFTSALTQTLFPWGIHRSAEVIESKFNQASDCTHWGIFTDVPARLFFGKAKQTLKRLFKGVVVFCVFCIKQGKSRTASVLNDAERGYDIIP